MQGIIHRDIKAANILITMDGTLKLADFGVSDYLNNLEEGELVGTPLWMAPEVLSRKKPTYACDIWSLGITLIEMGDGFPPYAELPALRAMRLTKSPKSPSPSFMNPLEWSDDLLSFVNVCLNKVPEKRPETIELFDHPFLTSSIGNDQIIKQNLLLSTRKATEDQETMTKLMSNYIKGTKGRSNSITRERKLMERKIDMSHLKTGLIKITEVDEEDIGSGTVQISGDETTTGGTVQIFDDDNTIGGTVQITNDETITGTVQITNDTIGGTVMITEGNDSNELNYAKLFENTTKKLDSPKS